MVTSNSQTSSGPSVSMAIRVRLVRLGKTETQLAQNLGVAPRTVQRWIATGQWGLRTLDEVARFLDWDNAIDIINASRHEKSPQVEATGNETQKD